jgi:hypothetical protein
VLARHVRNHRLGDALHQQAFCALNASPVLGPTTTSPGPAASATTPHCASWATG